MSLSYYKAAFKYPYQIFLLFSPRLFTYWRHWNEWAHVELCSKPKRRDGLPKITVFFFLKFLPFSQQVLQSSLLKWFFTSQLLQNHLWWLHLKKPSRECLCWINIVKAKSGYFEVLNIKCFELFHCCCLPHNSICVHWKLSDSMKKQLRAKRKCNQPPWPESLSLKQKKWQEIQGL